MRFLKNCSSFSSRAPFVSAFRMREAEGNNTNYLSPSNNSKNSKRRCITQRASNVCARRPKGALGPVLNVKGSPRWDAQEALLSPFETKESSKDW
jgi:hypothetical protein